MRHKLRTVLMGVDMALDSAKVSAKSFRIGAEAARCPEGGAEAGSTYLEGGGGGGGRG